VDLEAGGGVICSVGAVEWGVGESKSRAGERCVSVDLAFSAAARG
jgi:hypothetical protein